jgi:mono/diheme cytochrome c family protein
MPTLSPSRFLAACLCLASVWAADPTALPPLPSELPALAVPPTNPVVRRPRIILPPRSVPAPGLANAFTQRVGVASYQPPLTAGDDVLSWDSSSKEYTASVGETTAQFTFALTNVSKTNVTINWIRPSCGCTQAQHPPVPWNLAPNESGTISLGVDLRGKYGTLSKYVSIDTSKGQKMLNIQVHIPVAAATPGMDSREKNMQLAMADRQVVFRGDCARCHSAPAAGKHGEPLYHAACAICHDAPHRATMVPDLRALKNATGKDYWAFWITHGKPGSLMPAFAQTQGGPLTDDQIQSLADYLASNFPSVTPVGASPGSASAPPTGSGSSAAFPVPPVPARN